MREVAPAGSGGVSGVAAYKFAFPSPDLPFESYNGANARLRYYLRAVVVKSGYTGPTLSKDLDFIVQNVERAPASILAPGPLAPAGAGAPVGGGPAAGAGVKLEVGIEDCLHIEFEYDK